MFLRCVLVWSALCILLLLSALGCLLLEPTHHGGEVTECRQTQR
jgi:hypothetical protein